MHVKSDSTTDAHERRKNFLSDAFENDEAALVPACRPCIRTCFDIPAASRWPTAATTSADPRVGRSGRNALPMTRICPLISDFWDSVLGKGLEERVAAVVVRNWQALIGLAIAGAGITVLPRCYCKDELQRGELVELIQPRNPPLNRLYLVYATRNIRLPCNRAVRDTLLKAKAYSEISS